MAEKEVGYVELEWRCPSCGNRNPGSVKKCAQCGAALTEEVQFEQAPQETIITDQAKIAAAAAGADIQCGYCGTANSATATKCKQCGADLAEGKARAAGQVLGDFRDQPAAPLKCPSCGTDNPATALEMREAAPRRGAAANQAEAGRARSVEAFPDSHRFGHPAGMLRAGRRGALPLEPHHRHCWRGEWGELAARHRHRGAGARVSGKPGRMKSRRVSRPVNAPAVSTTRSPTRRPAPKRSAARHTRSIRAVASGRSSSNASTRYLPTGANMMTSIGALQTR